jgi:hypothetical protein
MANSKVKIPDVGGHVAVPVVARGRVLLELARRKGHPCRVVVVVAR